MKEKIGILHPGEMGISVAASAQNSGQTIFWASERRSPKTHQRAQSQSLIELHTLKELCETCSIIISICPPYAAEEVARQVLSHSFKGLYVDANAKSPQRAKHIAQMMSEAGVDFVDGGIIGEPAWEAATTWLYLSGKDAQRVADCFQAGPLETEVIGDEIGKASALKVCYSAYTKGTSALLCAILGTAERLEVRDELENQWSHGGSDFAEQTTQRVRRVTAKAWRFVGEMEEIARTFDAAGMPGGFHLAASEIYRLLADFKGSETTPSLSEVLSALLIDESKAQVE